MEKNTIDVLKDYDFMGKGVALPFPKEEYAQRLLAVRTEMERRDISLLYVTTPENLFYLSGFNIVWSRMTSSQKWNDSKATGIAVYVDSDEFILFEISDEEGSVLSGTCCTKPRIKDDTPGAPMMFGKQYDAPKEGETFLDVIVRDLKNEGWLKGKVALELGSARPNRLVSEQLQQRIEAQGCQVVDGTDILLNIRGIKSPLELKYIQRASEIADIGHLAIKNNIRVGITELELVGEYLSSMYKAGGESMAIVDMCRFGMDKFWCPHAPASRRKLKVGDPVAVDLCGVYNRYHSNQVRSYFLGTPGDEITEIGNNAVKVMKKTKELLKPNMLVNDFYKEMRQFFKDEGMWGDQYWLGGYELGISFPPDWVGSFVYDPYVDAGKDRFLPGMVVNFETGFGVIDTIMFTETEAKILGSTPWELQIVEAGL